MGKHSKQIQDVVNAARKEEFDAMREEIPNGQVGLALTAIKQRVEQDFAVSVAAYEIDNEIENSSYRIHPDPANAFPEIFAIKARLDALNKLIEKYQTELAAEYAEQEAGWEDAVSDPEIPEELLLSIDEEEDVAPETDPADQDA